MVMFEVRIATRSICAEDVLKLAYKLNVTVDTVYRHCLLECCLFTVLV